MTLKIKIAKKIPLPIINNTFLLFPFLYKTRLINYESYLDETSINELLNFIKNHQDLRGNIIECGCARCGTTVIMGNFLKSNNIKKKIFALDSFEGFDKKELQYERSKDLTQDTSESFTYSSLEYVSNKIKKLKLSNIIVPIKGYFEETLPGIDSEFCMAFIDCDLEKSVTFTAETTWKRLMTGGQLFFDDYISEGYQGVKLAVDAFVKHHDKEIDEHGISSGLYHITKKEI